MPGPLAGFAFAGLLSAVGAAFSRLVMSQGGKWVVGILLAMGIQLAVTGVTLLPFKDRVTSAMNGIPAEIAAWMGVLQIDVYVSCVVSAYLIANLRGVLKARKAAS